MAEGCAPRVGRPWDAPERSLRAVDLGRGAVEAVGLAGGGERRRDLLHLRDPSPALARGGIVGGPPTEPGTTLYLSGPEAEDVAALFAGSVLAARVVVDASAVKMAYAAWSKGTAAMLLAIREVARHYGVEDEWQLAAPELAEPLARAEVSAARKGWRWVGEMQEIADAFAAAGQPDGFHRAAAEVYRA